MKTWLTITGVLITASAAALAGYCLGFREAWVMGLRADAAPRGVLAISQLQSIEQGRIDDVRALLESDIDSGLVLWYDLSRSPLHPAINTLSGTEVFPEYEQYIRRLAAYRKAHRSSLSDPAKVQSMLETAAKTNPEFARELKQGNERAVRAIDTLVKKYGQ